MTLNIYGIRHHGVGCSRALVDALVEQQPDIILIESPADAQDAIDCLRDPRASSKLDDQMQTPVGMLAYETENPKNCVISPFVDFSPEWVAISYGIVNDVEIRFIDLPSSVKFALSRNEKDDDNKDDDNKDDDNKEDDSKDGKAETSAEEERKDDVEGESEDADAKLVGEIIRDPIGTIARIAGDPDPERWEERAIEAAVKPGRIFPGFLELMTELRFAVRDAQTTRRRSESADALESECAEGAEGDATDATDANASELEKLAVAVARQTGGSDRDLEQLREAHMRREIRAALKKGKERVAVVCGAWHAPVLDLETTDARRLALIPSKSIDDKLLSRLPKVKTSFSWIPWTNSRMTRRSGYGAGIEAPAFLGTIWNESQEARTLDRMTGRTGRRVDSDPARESDVSFPYRTAVVKTLSRAARLLRDDGGEAAAANVVDAARFADTLAAVRGRANASLDEIRDAVRCVFCDGEEQAFRAVQQRLEVGNEIGVAPKRTTKPPLAKEIESQSKKLRLARAEEERTIKIDTREDVGMRKSIFFRRLNLIDVPWATFVSDPYARGTFSETWTLAWRPEYEIQIIDASRYGSTLLDAASEKTLKEVEESTELHQIVKIVDRVLPAKLSDDALGKICRKLNDVASLSNDVLEAIKSIPALVSAIRYGSARNDFQAELTFVFEILFNRILDRLREICVNIDEEAARECVDALTPFVDAVALLDDREKDRRLFDAFERLANDVGIAQFVAGWLARKLHGNGVWSEQELGDKLRFYTGRATNPEDVSMWLGGLIYGTGQSILWLQELWTVFDEWLLSMDSQLFQEQSAMLRRAFAPFEQAERRKLMEVVKKLRKDDDQLVEDQTNASLPQEMSETLKFILS